MQEGWNNMKKVLKKTGKRLLFILLPLILIIVLLAGAVYVITIDDGTYKEGDWSSTNYGVSQFINGLTVNGDNKISNTTSAQELWDKMIESGCRVDRYLSTPEELVKLMMAEIVTKFPDIRDNPDTPIDWSQIDWTKVINNEAELQGIIKFKRSDENNKVSTMKYATEEEFYKYIEQYNSTGDENAKKAALTHFTLKKVTSSATASNGVNAIAAGEGVMTDVSQAIIDATNSVPWPGEGLCQAWVYRVYTKAGLSPGGYESAYIASKSNIISTDMTAIPIGAAVYGTGSGTSGHYGHVGIYIGGGKIVDSLNSGIKVSNSFDEWLSWQKDVIDGKQGWLGWGWADGNTIRGTTQDTSIVSNNKNNTGNTNTANKNNTTANTANKNNTTTSNSSSKTNSSTQKGEVIQESGDGYEQEYKSSSGITYKEYRQNRGSYTGSSYWTGTISSDGCGPTALSIIASGLTNYNYTPKDIADLMTKKYAGDVYSSSERLQETAESLGMSAEVVYSPSASDIQDNLRNGKVMILSTHNRDKFSNGAHFITLLDIDTEGRIFVSNPNAQKDTGWQNIDDIMDRRDNIVVIDTGKVGISNANASSATTKKESTYVAMVATWKEIDTYLESDDSSVRGEYGIGTGRQIIRTEYSMTTTTIDYQSMVSQYAMPFDLLWAFLVVGEDKNFAMEIADLVYNSDIQITVYDNLKTETDIDTWDYTKRKKAVINASVTGHYKTESEFLSVNHSHDPYEDEPFTTIKTVITKTNTMSAILTRANTWVVDYKNEYTYSGAETTEADPYINTQRDGDYGETPYGYASNDFVCKPKGNECEIISSAESLLKEKVAQSWNSHNFKSGDFYKGDDMPENTIKAQITSADVDTTVVYNSVEFYLRYVKITDTFTRSVETIKYISGTPETKEKTDPDATEPNFVQIFLKPKYAANKNNTISVASWLFEIIETNESTANLLDLVKYLLQKATGSNFGITDDFITIWNNTRKSTVVSVDGDIPVHTPVTTKEQFIQAMSEFAASGKMGEAQQAGFEKHFLNRSAEIYDLGLKYNINPELVVVIARHEQSFQDVTQDHSESNFWGLAVYNGMNVAGSYGSFEGGVEAFAKAWASYDVGGSLEDLVLERYNDFYAVNPEAAGLPGTFKGGLSVYTWGGKPTMEENAQEHLDGWKSRIGSWADIFGAYGSLTSTGSISNNSTTTKNSNQTSSNTAKK